MKKSAIATELGIIRGRDALYLDNAIFKDGMNTLVLEGQANGNLCSKPQRGSYLAYRLTFKGVLAVKMIELDSWDCDAVSSFDEVHDSEWIRDLRGKVTDQHRHFCVQTYDEVFDV